MTYDTELAKENPFLVQSLHMWILFIIPLFFGKYTDILCLKVEYSSMKFRCVDTLIIILNC